MSLAARLAAVALSATPALMPRNDETPAVARVFAGDPPGIRTRNLRIKRSIRRPGAIRKPLNLRSSCSPLQPSDTGFCCNVGCSPYSLLNSSLKSIGISVTASRHRCFGADFAVFMGFPGCDANAPP